MTSGLNLASTLPELGPESSYDEQVAQTAPQAQSVRVRAADTQVAKENMLVRPELGPSSF